MTERPTTAAAAAEAVRTALIAVGKAEQWDQVPAGTLRTLKDAIAEARQQDAERLAEALHAEDFDGIVASHEPDGPLSDCPAARPTEADMEKLTTEELARDAYLAVISMDDALPDNQSGYGRAVALTSEVWARLRPATCEVEGCDEPHTKHFPLCVAHLRQRAIAEGRLPEQDR